MANSKNKEKNKKIDAIDMFLLAAATYVCQLVYYVYYDIIWDHMIDTLGGNLGTLFIRVLCCITWGLSVYLIIKLSRNGGFDPLRITEKPTAIQWVFASILAAAFIGFFIYLDGGFKGTLEKIYGEGNIIEIISRFVFLAFQSALMVLTMSFGQKGGDLLLKKWNRYIPFGGLMLGICMMLANIITAGFSMTAVYMLGAMLIFGMVFVLTGKNALIAAPFIYLMFIMI